MKIKGLIKRHLGKIIFGIIILIVLLLGGSYYLLTHMEYNQIEVVESYTNEDAGDGSYKRYSAGVLKYSRDGIALLSEKGEEIWNQPCQMSHPVVEVCKDTVVVADKGGTSVYVFQKNGLKGEIQTTMPIERVTVSSQGIVAAILKNGDAPKVMCYDADGNILVEHKASLSTTGYPMDIALSQDGTVLMVSYLGTKGSGIASKVAYYNFAEAGADKDNYQVAELEYVDTVIPVVSFLDKKQSLLVADNQIILMEGLDNPQEIVRIPVEKEIKRVAYNEKYIVLVLKNSGQADYELLMYRTDGKQILSTQFQNEYANIEIEDHQIIMYEGEKCAIYNQAGICKFEGELERNIVSMYPIFGFNKYIVISTSGFQEIQLVK